MPRRAGIKQLYSLAAFHLPEETFESEVLILGGSTQLERRDSYYVGDLSGISARELPSWFQHFYRPGEEVAAQSDWKEKLEEITRRAADWDVGIVMGVPSWVQLLFGRLCDYHGVETVHEIWPKLSVYVHAGVAFGPYRRSLERYLIGGVIRFTDASDARFVIEGRTSHFLSLAGEHLSVDNMVQAVQRLEDEFDLSVPEFTVAGVREGEGFAHHWFMGAASEVRLPAEQMRLRLDAHLRTLNDDYGAKRSGPLGPITLTVLPVEHFYAWLERHGRLGVQNKFPRVLSGERLDDWLAFTAGADTARGNSRD